MCASPSYALSFSISVRQVGNSCASRAVSVIQLSRVSTASLFVPSRCVFIRRAFFPLSVPVIRVYSISIVLSAVCTPVTTHLMRHV